MSEYAQSERAATTRSSAVAHASPQRGPAPAQQDALAESLNQSARVRSLVQTKQMLHESPRMQSQRALQRALNPGFGSEAIQREAEPDEEETLQGKFGPAQRRENRTGLPDRLKAGAESLSGLSLDDVRVHYNSPQPAQLLALAYAQGADIHVAPGQEKHLPHEAWHIVQQMQGRVQPTLQMKNVAINDDAGLEREADLMAARALQASHARPVAAPRRRQASDQPIQPRVVIGMHAFATMSQVANNNVAWAQYATLNGPQRRAFGWLVSTSEDYALHDVTNFAATVVWMIANGLQDQALFADMSSREMTSMSFLVKEADYANWPHRAQAITFLLTLPMADASAFAHRYKSYYHLWRRFELAGDVNPGARVEHAMLNVEGAIIGPNARPEQQAGTLGDQQTYIHTLAQAGKLRFGDRASAAGHFIKHGSYLSGTGKITGEEGAGPLTTMATNYIQHANFVVANGSQEGTFYPSDGPVYRYVYTNGMQKYFALVQYDVNANAAFLLSYYPSEDPNTVMDR